MNVFDGLYLYEIVLLTLGVVLFLVLVAALLILLIKRRSFSKLLPFFGIPVLMIGFPGIRSVSFQNGVATITTVTPELQKNPTNTELRQTLEKAVKETSSRPANDPNTIVKIAAAQFALGDHQAAEARLDTALQKAPQLPAAATLQKKIELNRNLTRLTAQVEQHPQNQAAKAKLQEVVAEGSTLAISSPVLIANLARAEAAVGNNKRALALADQALKIQPNLSTAAALKERIVEKK
jgi:tetratricopeptide (TPR) repeat protein